MSVFGDNYIITIQNIHNKLMYLIFETIYQIDLNGFCVTSLKICVLHQHHRK